MRNGLRPSRFTQTMEQAAGSNRDRKENGNSPTRNYSDAGSQVYASDEIEVPAYLRNRTKK